jgi:Flp pilus assembly protein TadD
MWLRDWLFGNRRRTDYAKAESHRKQGLAHLTNGDYAQAIAELTEAVAYAQEDPDLHNGLAACYRALGDEMAADRHKSRAQ